MTHSLSTYAERAIEHLSEEAVKLEAEGQTIRARQCRQMAMACQQLFGAKNIQRPTKRLPADKSTRGPAKPKTARQKLGPNIAEIPPDKQAAALAALERGDIHTALALRHGV